ncbi:MAG: PilZ domain-containing protein [Planctomycetes bacterium]|nr:PilZ domain-containing protein [Planctomycetota bacterium]
MAWRHRDRRLHSRIELSCPLEVADSRGRELFRIRTANVSNGGLYLESPISNLPEDGVPDEVQLRLSIPRSTPNTFMLEDFATAARIVRSEPLAEGDAAGIAMQFVRPLALNLP